MHQFLIEHTYCMDALFHFIARNHMCQWRVTKMQAHTLAEQLATFLCGAVKAMIALTSTKRQAHAAHLPPHITSHHFMHTTAMQPSTKSYQTAACIIQDITTKLLNISQQHLVQEKSAVLLHAAGLKSLGGVTHHIWDLEQVPQGLPFALLAVNRCIVAVGMQHRPTWPACVDHHQPNISVALHLQHRTSLVAA